MTDTKPYAGASFEPLDDIRKALCESDRGGLMVARCRALWNEIERLRELCRKHNIPVETIDEQRKLAGRPDAPEFGV